MNIKGIIFDKDGTLFDFQSSWGEITFQFLKKLSDGNSSTLEKLAKVLHFDLKTKLFNRDSVFISGTTSETIAMLQPIIPQKNKDQIFSIHHHCYENQKQIPIKNLYKILLNLHKKGYQMAISTNDLVGLTNMQLKDTDIFNFFSAIIGSDSGYGAKPNPSQLIEIQKKMRLKSREIVMVGDSASDMLAAKSAGMRTFAVLTGVALKEDLEPFSEIVVRDISYLPKWLKAQNN